MVQTASWWNSKASPLKRVMMSLPLSVEPYFRAWIGVDTWHTGDLSDLKRFYRFVWAVHRYCRPRKGVKKSKKRLPSDEEIRLAIIDARKDSFSATALEDEARHFSSLYSHLLDFADTLNQPDHIIEKTDILKYYFQLERDLGGFSTKREEIATYMRRDWGEDWQEKLDEAKRRLG
jgi:hypothetical protein